MAEVEDIIMQVRIDNSKTLTDMAKLTEQIEELKNSNKELTKTTKAQNDELKKIGAEQGKNSAEYKKAETALNANRAAVESNKQAIKTLSAEYNNQAKSVESTIRMQTLAEGSLRQMKAELTKLNQEYENLSQTERESSDVGQKLLKTIQEKADAYNGAQMEARNYYVNVGNYQKSMEGALAGNNKFMQGLFAMNNTAKETGKTFGSTLVNSMKGVGKAMLQLLANPLVAAIAGIAVLLMGIVKIIKSNEEQMLRLNAVFAPFKRLLDGVLNVLQKMVDSVLSFIEFIMKGLGMVMKLLESLPLVGDAMKEINDETRESIELEKAKNDLVTKRREELITFAEIDRDIAKLRQQATDKENFTLEQRTQFLRDANALSLKKLELAQENLREELRIAEAEAARNKNSAEVNDNIARLKAEIIKAEQTYYEEVKGNSKKLNAFIAEERAARQAADDARIAKQKEWAELYKANLTQIRDLTINLMNEGADKEIAALEARLKDELEKVKGSAKQKIEIERLLREQFEKDKQAITEKYELENLTKIEQRIAEEMRIRADLAEKGSAERLTAQLQILEVERQEAIRNATETGVSVDLVNKEFDAKRKELVKTNEQEVLQVRREAYENYIREKESQFQTELLKIADNESAKSELMIEQEQQRLTDLLNLDSDQKKALGLNETEYARVVEEQRAKVNGAIKANIDLQKKQMDEMRGGLFAVGDAVSEVLNIMADNQEEYSAFAKIAALFQIAIESAKSIATAVAGATAAAAETGPAAPYVVAGYIASMVATVLAGIAQAYSVIESKPAPNAPSFATGGSIKGAGSGTSDSIIANVSNGESILTAKATNMFAPLLSSLNQLGGGVPITVMGTAAGYEGEEMLARAFRKGAESLPAPVVSVEEINRVSNRVEVLEGLRS